MSTVLSERDLENLSWAKKFLNDYERRHKMKIDEELTQYYCKSCGYTFWGLPGLTICPSCTADNLDDYVQDPVQ